MREGAPSMRILADENITAVREFFGPYGLVTTMPGRKIDSQAVKDCDVLLVRSITRVDSTLLQGSPCRFVGTATSGIDHIDTGALQEKGIAFAAAEGCNSLSVVDYVFSVLAVASPIAGLPWRACTVGIIGCGRIGAALAERLLALGVTIKIYDPLLGGQHPLHMHFASLETVLNQDVVTLHVPLTTSGPFPTFHMIDRVQLMCIRKDALLINAARGAAINNNALSDWLQERPSQRVVLDTWEGEPAINLQLLRQVELGTPHIAGYSKQGKLNGTRMLRDRFCQQLGLAISEDGSTAPLSELQIPQADPQTLLDHLILATYDVRRDHQAMQRMLSGNSAAAEFDALRKHYPAREEMSAYKLDSRRLPKQTAADAALLGFTLC